MSDSRASHSNIEISDTPLPTLEPRAADSHKGDFGHVLLIGGSRGMAGAISMAGLAALRSGAGRVTLAVPDVCLDVVASFEPSYMTLPLLSDDAGRISREALQAVIPWLERVDCVACGPGLGRSTGLDQFVADLLESCHCPLVLDADALNALAPWKADRHPTSVHILTPHPGEFRRLLGQQDAQQASRASAIRFARAHSLILLLKGHRSFITNGQTHFENRTGNPGMATGGSGDILTGVVTGLVGQGLNPLDATRLGAHVHGLAGDIAAAEVGQVALIASDLLDGLPEAFESLA